MKLLMLSLVTFGILFSMDPALAKNKSSASSSSSTDDFVCRKMHKVTLRNMKRKLMQTCDVNRPFSLGYGKNLEDNYVVCCHENPNPDEESSDDEE